MPAPHPRNLALTELMKVHKLQHQDRILILLRERPLNRRTEEVKERLFAGQFFRLRSSLEEILRRIGRRRNVDAEALTPFQIDQAIRRDREQPGFKGASSLIFCQ